MEIDEKVVRKAIRNAIKMYKTSRKHLKLYVDGLTALLKRTPSLPSYYITWASLAPATTGLSPIMITLYEDTLTPGWICINIETMYLANHSRHYYTVDSTLTICVPVNNDLLDEVGVFQYQGDTTKLQAFKVLHAVANASLRGKLKESSPEEFEAIHEVFNRVEEVINDFGRRRRRKLAEEFAKALSSGIKGVEEVLAKHMARDIERKFRGEPVEVINVVWDSEERKYVVIVKIGDKKYEIKGKPREIINAIYDILTSKESRVFNEKACLGYSYDRTCSSVLSVDTLCVFYRGNRSEHNGKWRSR